MCYWWALFSSIDICKADRFSGAWNCDGIMFNLAIWCYWVLGSLPCCCKFHETNLNSILLLYYLGPMHWLWNYIWASGWLHNSLDWLACHVGDSDFIALDRSVRGSSPSAVPSASCSSFNRSSGPGQLVSSSCGTRSLPAWAKTSLYSRLASSISTLSSSNRFTWFVLVTLWQRANQKYHILWRSYRFA
jgi:hypothetical protein